MISWENNLLAVEEIVKLFWLERANNQLGTLSMNRYSKLIDVSANSDMVKGSE